MIAGAIGFLVYAALCVRLMKKRDIHVTKATIAGLAVWIAVAMSGWLFFLS
jgi:Trk-type K+ transport system membrane component